ncbi:MAG: hypothetical protein WC819_04840 [Parcubacteria group bacterium]|jgi:hypothetical protein
MIIKSPKNSEKYYWTEHAKAKMRQYGLSAQRVTRVIRSPQRKEESIVGNGTIAVMQPQSTRRDASGKKTWNSEIWVMYKYAKKKVSPTDAQKVSAEDNPMMRFLNNVAQNQKQIHIISAWRYPGKTEPGESLPDEITDEIAEIA